MNMANPYVYVLGTDTNLYVGNAAGSTCGWHNLGTPGIAITDAYGCVTLGELFTQDQYPCCFVRCADGNLWRNLWDGDVFAWTNLGQPSEQAVIVSSLGAITSVGLDNATAWCFCLCSDGAIWYHGTDTGKWTQLPAPAGVGIVKSMGITAPGSGRPYVYVLGSDNNLWLAQYNDAWAWQGLGTRGGGIAIAQSLGALSTDEGRPYCYVIGSDGETWQNFYSYGWNWDKLVGQAA